MIKKIALLAAALTLTMPAFAQTSSGAPTASPPAATDTAKPAKKHHKHGHKKAKAEQKKDDAAK